jgi:hypothetical protein
MKIKMTPTVAICLTLLIAALELAVHAQDQTNQPQPAKPPTITWKKDDPNCDLIVVEGSRYRIIKRDGLFIAFEFVESRDLYVAAVYVANDSDGRVLVDPQSSILALWKDVKKEAYEIVAPTPPEKVAKKIESRARWANALRAFGAGMATTQTTTYTGSDSVTTIAPDLEARSRADRQNAETTGQAEDKAAGVMSAALKANTLFSKEYVSGEIYFQKKKFEAGYFVFKIGDAFYQFTVRPAQK